MHVIGGTRTGKSKFLEWTMRQDIRAGHGFTLIDWHGTLYHDVLAYCAKLEVGLNNDFRRVVLLNPSQPEFITGFNPFIQTGEDISTDVNRHIDATVRPWGESSTNETPTFERTARVLYQFMAETGETLANAAEILDFDQRGLREYAILNVKDRYTCSQLRKLQGIKTWLAPGRPTISAGAPWSEWMVLETPRYLLAGVGGQLTRTCSKFEAWIRTLRAIATTAVHS